ncbi:hypothetical protein K523DRAFT_422171 [Schizophyllum commune Tattone D]|nr:hypothetical protein K523DRAFT_422171 [Schizophyllum commune Tattone D]
MNLRAHLQQPPSPSSPLALLVLFPLSRSLTDVYGVATSSPLRAADGGRLDRMRGRIQRDRRAHERRGARKVFLALLPRLYVRVLRSHASAPPPPLANPAPAFLALPPYPAHRYRLGLPSRSYADAHDIATPSSAEVGNGGTPEGTAMRCYRTQGTATASRGRANAR